MAFVDVNDVLKVSIYDDEEAAVRLRLAGVSGRRIRLLRSVHRTHTRSARRTDFGRPGRFRFFARGRSLPTKTIGVGHPEVFRFSIGMHVGPGTVVAMDIPRGMIWVTP